MFAAILIPFILCGTAAAADGQWVVSAYGGAIHTVTADIELEQPGPGTALTFPDVPFRSESYDPPIYYGYRVSRNVPLQRRVFVEAELIHGKLFARGDLAPAGAGQRNGVAVDAVPFSSVVQRFGMSHGLNFILFNVALRLPTQVERLTITARAGVGPMLPHRETQVDGETEEGYQWAGLGVQAGGGLELRIWRRVNVVTEYKRTHARPRVSVHAGTAVVSADSHHLALGLSLVL
jgi:hypothetical protein